MVDEVRVRAHPWIPVRNSGDLQAAGKLVEELGELIALLSRCTIQGVNECEPVTSKLNKLAIEEEVANVMIGLRLFARRFDLDRRAINHRVGLKVPQPEDQHKTPLETAELPSEPVVKMRHGWAWQVWRLYVGK